MSCLAVTFTTQEIHLQSSSFFRFMLLPNLFLLLLSCLYLGEIAIVWSRDFLSFIFQTGSFEDRECLIEKSIDNRRLLSLFLSVSSCSWSRCKDFPMSPAPPSLPLGLLERALKVKEFPSCCAQGPDDRNSQSIGSLMSWSSFGITGS